MNPPAALYKFVVPERIDVLEKKLIRFTQPSALNDPFELQPLFETILPDDEFEEAATPPFEMIEEAVARKYNECTPEQRAQLPSLATITGFLNANPLVLQSLLADVMPTLRRFASDFAPRLREQIAQALGTMKNISRNSYTCLSTPSLVKDLQPNKAAVADRAELRRWA